MTARRALLVACSEYQDPKLRRLRSPVHDVAALGEVLRDPAIGGFDVVPLINRPESEVRRAAARFLRVCQRTDTLLLFIACHGFKDIDGQLYFAGADTDLDDIMASAIPAELLHRLINRSPSRRIVLILDCCFSGAISRTMTYRGEDDIEVGEYFPDRGEGLAIITASKAEEYAWEPTAEPFAVRDNALHSVFAQALIEGLRTGAADLDGDGEISIDDLYWYVNRRVAATGTPQTPSRWNSLAGTLIVAHRATAPRPSPPPEPLPGAPRTPWDAALLNWRFPIGPALAQLLRTRARDGAEAFGWAALRNAEWDRAGDAFEAAAGSADRVPSARLGSGYCAAVDGRWPTAGENFALAAAGLRGATSPEELALLATATLLAAVAFDAAGSARAHEIADEGVALLPYCPQLLAYHGALLDRPDRLAEAFLLVPELIREFRAVGIDVDDTVGRAVTEAQRRSAPLASALARLTMLRGRLPGLGAARPVPEPASQLLPSDHWLGANIVITNLTRATLAAEIAELHAAAERLLSTATDRPAMALVGQVRETISAAYNALGHTDRPVPVMAIGVPPRLEP